MNRRVALAALVAASLAIGLTLAYQFRKPVMAALKPARPAGASYTVEQRVAQFGQGVAARLAADFSAAGVPYPPHEVAYLAFKDARQLQVYARSASSKPWRFIRQYEVLAASGKPGPKLIEGDRQVPEGIYQAELLNPNSRFHLSIRLDYPNDFDRRMAQRDGRTRLGGDIMIHGNAVSAGCLAMGDEAAEELFILAAKVGKERTRIVVSPTDWRTAAGAAPRHAASWSSELYAALRAELEQYPTAPARPEIGAAKMPLSSAPVSR